MSDGGSTSEARTALGTLLRRLGIAKVVCVDDEHASSLTLEAILAWVELSSPDALAGAFPDFKDQSVPDVDVRKEKFRLWWNGLDATQQEEHAATARPFVQA